MLNKQWLAAKEMSNVLIYLLLSFLLKEVILHVIIYFFTDNPNQYIYDILPIPDLLTMIIMIFFGVVASAYAYFPLFVQYGVTRKQAFIANIIGIIGGTVILILFAVVISVLQQSIFQWLDILVSQENIHIYQLLDFGGGIEALSPDHFLLGSSTLAFISRWSMTILTFGSIIFLDYVIGWMIGTGFYRFDTSAAIAMILPGVLFILLRNTIWVETIFYRNEWIASPFTPFVSWVLAIVGTIVMILLGLWIIRSMTKRISIRVY